MIIQPSTCSPPSERSVLTALRIKVHTSRPIEHTRPRLFDDESGRKCAGTRANSVLRSGARTSYLCPNQTLTLTNVASMAWGVANADVEVTDAAPHVEARLE